MANPTLEFSSLPLLRVEYMLVFEQPSPNPSLDELISLRQTFQERLPAVTDFTGPGGKFSINVGAGMGAGFDNLEKGIGLAVRGDRMFVAWQRLRPDFKYVRYDLLRDMLLEALPLLADRKIATAAGVYANLIPTNHGDPHRLLQEELFPKLPDGTVSRDTRGVWELDKGEYRLNLSHVPEGSVLETVFSAEATDDSAEDLDRAHRELVERFEKVITEEAMHVWKLERR